MKIVDKEKDVYQLFLDKGCISYHDLSNEDKIIVSNLIEKNLLCKEEMEHSDFIVLIKNKIDDIENKEDFNYDYDSIDIQIKECIRMFRKERNSFLKFIAEEVVVYGEEILKRLDSLIFNKCASYIKNYQVKGISLYHLNPLGYKAIHGEYDKNIINLAILRCLNNSIAGVNGNNNSLAMIKVLRKLKTDFFLNCLDLGEYKKYKKYEKYFTQMEQLGLIEFFYGKDYKLMCLTEKAYDIVAYRDENKNYTGYKKNLDSKIKRIYPKTYILTEEHSFIKKIINYNLVKKSELDEASENLREFLNEYVLSIEFLNNEYIYLKGEFYSEHGITNKKSNLLNSALEFLVENNIENIPELDNTSKKGIYKMFSKSRALDKTLDASLWKSGFYIRELKDSIKHKVFLDISILIHKEILSLKVAGNKTYILITKKGCKYFDVPKYNVSEEKILKRELMRNDYEGILWEIYNQKFISKSKVEKLYGKNICSDIKDYIKELILNGYSYIELSNVGCCKISRKYIPNKSTVIYTLKKNLKVEEDLDVLDKTILNFIYKYNFIRYSDLVVVVGHRAKELLASGFLNRHDKNREVSVSEKGCFLIEKKHVMITDKYIDIYSQKIRSSRVYFFKKELSAELIKIVNTEEIYDKAYILERCNKVLAACNESLDKKYQKGVLTSYEENILYTIWSKKLCFHKNSLNKNIHDKFNKFGVLKVCKGGKYITVNELCSARYKKMNLEGVKLYPIIESGADSEYTMLNNTLILKRLEDVQINKKNKTTGLKADGKKQQAIKSYKESVKYLFNGVSGDNLKKHIEFLKNGKYIIFDTEFSTIKGDKTNMIEISAIKVDKLNIVDKFSYLIRDHKDMLTRSVSKLTKIKKDMLEKDGVEERYALNKFIEFIEDLPVIAHAVENDWHACVLLGCENNNIPLPKNEISDSYLILKSIYPKGKCGLDGLISKFNLKSKEIPRHRALGDSIYTLNAIKKAVESKNKKTKIKPKIEGEAKMELVRRESVNLELIEVI